MSETETDRAVAQWFETPYLMTMRPTAGASDAAILVENHAAASRGRIWRPGSTGDLLPIEVSFNALLTADERWIIDLDDGGGSEVGGLVALAVDGSERVELTPGRGDYVLRGLEQSHDGSHLVATLVDEDGFHVIVIPAQPWGPPRTVYSSPIEAWYGLLSSDAGLASVDTTDHNPGIRRPRVTVVDTATGETVGILDDLPAGPIRAARFSTAPGDDRLLVATERSGFARPAIWNPRTGDRVDYDLPELDGEVIPLDWHAASGRVLVLHVEDGLHRLLVLDENDGSTSLVAEGAAFANPDVADVHPFQWASYFAPDGAVRVLRSRWNEPLHLIEDGVVLIHPASTPPGTPLASTMVPSADGTGVQVWLGRPEGKVRGTVLEVHGGPMLVTVDEFNPSAQAWISAGFAYASLNYRGSVTFGRAFREGFWGSGGDVEISDVDAAVTWLRSQGLADPASSFITGASFGGHLTLLSMGRLPGLFAGGLAHVAVADWAATIGAMNPAVRSVWSSWVPPEMVERFSAVSYADRMTGSIWINQGSVDTRTPIVGVQRLVDELGAAGGDIVMDVFEGGHEPTGLELLGGDQRRMTQLVRRTLAGERWSTT